jgi:hypothetical protein
VLITTYRDNPSPTRANPTRSHALSSDRLEAFLRETPRDGNIAVILPDCTPNIRINRKKKMRAMEENIEHFIREYGS